MKKEKVKMKDGKPTIGEWKKLYNAAFKMKENECWNIFNDNDIFGIKDPETGMIGYCSVMGRLGEHYGLAVHKGTRGLEGLLSMQDGNIEPTLMGALQAQNCLMASFEDRKYLDGNDHKIIKKLGLKFRGPNSWPVFRDYTSGYHPWYLNSSDVRFLTLALEQTVHIYRRIGEDPDLLNNNEDSHFLVRVLGSDGIEWKDEWLYPEPPTPDTRDPDFGEVPELKDLMERIRKNKKLGIDTWEIGTFFSLKSVREGHGRPYYPKMFVYADNGTGLILSFLPTEPTYYQAIFLHHFLSYLAKADELPGKIFTSDEEIISLLLPLAKELDIDLIKSDRLPVVEEFRNEMAEYME